MKTLIALDPCKPAGEPTPGLLVRLGDDGVTFEEVKPFEISSRPDGQGGMVTKMTWHLQAHVPQYSVIAFRDTPDAPKLGHDHG